MTNETPINVLMDAAIEVAFRYKNNIIAPEHLLYALCLDGDIRQEIIETYAGDTDRISSFLTRSFKDRATASEWSGSSLAGQELSRFLSLFIDLENITDSDEVVISADEILDLLIGKCEDFPVVCAALDYGNVISIEETSISSPDENNNPTTVHKNNTSDNTEIQEEKVNIDPNKAAMLNSLRNLSYMAKNKELDPVIGRTEEIDNIIKILSRHRKSNAVLVGPAGVGKTAIIEGLASVLVEKKNDVLSKKPIIEVSMSSMMAGTRYRGDFEARFKYLMDLAEQNNAILFIDEAHIMMSTGAGSSANGIDAANMLKPALARGGVSVVMATTSNESRVLLKDKAFARRFQKIDISEPGKENTKEIIEQSCEGYETHYNVKLTPESLDVIIDHSAEFLPERTFPDKAFDVLEHTLQSAQTRSADFTDIEDVNIAIKELTGFYPGRPKLDILAKANNLEQTMIENILGQDSNMKLFSRIVKQSMLGFSASLGKGCASSFLFNGPSGVGKTESALKFAEYMELPYKRIDMSEFMDSHSISGLIGSPPGYVGYNEEGKLIEYAQNYPNMVLLLDEVDKAHPKVFDLLLQILDAGRLTSADGRMVSFKGVHLIMTSNIGVVQSEKNSIGFGRKTDAIEIINTSVLNSFRPEFIERLSAVLQFNQLDKASVLNIIKKEMKIVRQNFEKKGITLLFDESLVEFLFQNLPDGKISGRKIKKLIDKTYIEKLSDYFFSNPAATLMKAEIKENKVIIE